MDIIMYVYNITVGVKKMTVGEKIKKTRELRKVAQVDLATTIGISKQTLYKYENGIITNIPSDKIEAIAKALDTTPAYLMGWNENNADSELQEYLEELKNRPEMRMLFSLAKGATKEDVEKAVKIIEALRNNN